MATLAADNQDCYAKQTLNTIYHFLVLIVTNERLQQSFNLKINRTAQKLILSEVELESS